MSDATQNDDDNFNLRDILFNYIKNVECSEETKMRVRKRINKMSSKEVERYLQLFADSLKEIKVFVEES